MNFDRLDEDHASFRFGWWSRATVVRQGHPSECGLACIAMLLAYHGQSISLSDLRRRLALSNRGMTLAQLVSAADQMDLQTRALRIEIDEVRNLRLPAIAHVDGNHFVVLDRVVGRRVTIFDPR